LERLIIPVRQFAAERNANQTKIVVKGKHMFRMIENVFRPLVYLIWWQIKLGRGELCWEAETIV
jgi:hypothetical protein